MYICNMYIGSKADHSGRSGAATTRRATAKRSVSSDTTARPEGECVNEQPLTGDGTTTSLSCSMDAIRLFDRPSNIPMQFITDSAPIQTLDNGLFWLDRPFKPRLKFPPDEDFAMARVQYDVTTKLLHWLIPESDDTTVGTEFLHDMLHLWQQKASGFRQILGERYDALYSILGAWVKERLAIVDISAKLTYGSELPHSMPRAKEDFNTLNTLRGEKLALLQVCPDEKLRSELLAEALSLLTDTKGGESVFRYGILRMHQNDMVKLGMSES
jgi:hypothetical protein